jgi:hypothetical protein
MLDKEFAKFARSALIAPREPINSMKIIRVQNFLAVALLGVLTFTVNLARAAELSGNVQGAGGSIAGSTVTLYAAGTGAPTQLAQGKTDDNGVFRLDAGPTPADSVLSLCGRQRHGESFSQSNTQRSHRLDGGVGNFNAKNSYGE